MLSALLLSPLLYSLRASPHLTLYLCRPAILKQANQVVEVRKPKKILQQQQVLLNDLLACICAYLHDI